MNILIVDDQPTDLKLLHTQLEAEGHVVFEACDGVKALAVLQRQSVDAVISDILMPRMDGLALVRQLNADPDTRDIHVVAVTCYAEQYPKAAALAAGCDAYLLKPISTRELSGQLTAVAEGGGGSQLAG